MFISKVSSPNSSRTSEPTSRPLARPLKVMLSVLRSSLSMFLPQPFEGALGADLEALQQRMVIKVILPHVQSPEVGMPLEGYPEHVVGLPLVPVGCGINLGYRVYDRLLAFYRGLDPNDPTAQVQELVGHLERPYQIHDRDEREVQN